MPLISFELIKNATGFATDKTYQRFPPFQEEQLKEEEKKKKAKQNK